MKIFRSMVNSILVIWFLLSLFRQYPDDAYDRFIRIPFVEGNFLLPNWKFFAPNPGIEDSVLMYRTGVTDDKNGDWSEWQRLIPPVDRSWWELFYSPRSRLDKGIFDIMTAAQMAMPLNGEDDQYRKYLDLLLGCVRREAKPRTGGKYVQALVVNSAGHEEKVSPRYELTFGAIPL